MATISLNFFLFREKRLQRTASKKLRQHKNRANAHRFSECNFFDEVDQAKHKLIVRTKKNSSLNKVHCTKCLWSQNRKCASFSFFSCSVTMNCAYQCERFFRCEHYSEQQQKLFEYATSVWLGDCINANFNVRFTHSASKSLLLSLFFIGFIPIDGFYSRSGF